MRVRKFLFCGIVLVSAAFFLLILTGSLNTASAKSLEYKLAVLDAGRSVPKDHITVARFRSLLKQLSDTYVENRMEIADATVTAQNLLRKDGIKESLLDIMEGMNQLFSKPIKNQKYIEYAAAYVTLRENGQSHSEAIRGLKALLKSMGVY